MQFGRNSMPFLRNGCAVLPEYTSQPPQNNDLLISLSCNIICIHSNIIVDESNGIMYSQNELNNSYYTIIQLVYYLRISYLQKNFHSKNIALFSHILSFYHSSANTFIPSISRSSQSISSTVNETSQLLFFIVVIKSSRSLRL